MNLEQIRDRIGIRWIEEDNRKVAVATLVLSYRAEFSPHSHLPGPGRLQWIEANLKEEILRMIFEDRRKEVWEAVEAVHMANPYNGDLREKLNHLFGLMKHAQPK